MQIRLFPLSDLIIVETKTPTKDTAWPTPSIFNMNFRGTHRVAQIAEALRGRGLYLISYGQEVVYLGKYRPEGGKIVADRWGRHLQTITGRGHQIGLGGAGNVQARLNKFLQAVAAEGLRQALCNALEHSRLERFRDTGCNTTPNRLRFASENWANFGTAGPETILRGFEFRLLQIRSPNDVALARQVVGDMEDDVLSRWHPVCNDEYVHQFDAQRRANNTPQALIEDVRRVALVQTGHDIDSLVHLQAQEDDHIARPALPLDIGPDAVAHVAQGVDALVPTVRA